MSTWVSLQVSLDIRDGSDPAAAVSGLIVTAPTGVVVSNVSIEDWDTDD